MSEIPRPLGLSTRRGTSHGAQSLGLMRVVNQQLVLDTLLNLGPASRAVISRASSLSKPTVSAVVRDLEACGLVRERGRGGSAVGRASTIYEVNPLGGFVVAFDVGGTKTRAGLTDLYGERVAELVEPTSRDGGPAVVAQLGRLCQALRADAGVEATLVRAAGVSLPGVINTVSDRVTNAFNVPGLDHIRPARDLKAALDLPVVVGNDVNLAAIGEMWRGRGAGVADFVVLSLGTGIGAGVVIGGELYTGSSGAAGEVGFLPLASDPFDPATQIGGPLESTASGPRMLENLVRARAAGHPTTADPDGGVPAIFAAAVTGDSLAMQLIEDEARWVALAIASIAAVLDPELVILCGGVGSNPGLIGPVRRHVARLLPHPPIVEAGALDNRAPYYGAVAAALQVAREQLLAQAYRPLVAGGREAQGRFAAAYPESDDRRQADRPIDGRGDASRR